LENDGQVIGVDLVGTGRVRLLQYSDFESFSGQGRGVVEDVPTCTARYPAPMDHDAEYEHLVGEVVEAVLIERTGDGSS
jgi:hypothetical protein